ncbi:hypothetical protein NKG05_12010 [Oerskovia sp. M15]
MVATDDVSLYVVRRAARPGATATRSAR